MDAKSNVVWFRDLGAWFEICEGDLLKLEFGNSVYDIHDQRIHDMLKNYHNSCNKGIWNDDFNFRMFRVIENFIFDFAERIENEQVHRK